MPPTETVEADAGKAPADQMSNRPEKIAAERAPVPKAEAVPDPAMRSQDSAAAVKTGADLVQNLGVSAPVHHAAPTQSTAAANAAAAAAPTPAPAATVPVAGLAVEIAAQSNAGRNRFEIRLDPPELGRIDVRLEIDGDGQVKSRLIVERSETLDMLRRDAPQLERALQQAGLKTSDNALEFSLRDQAPQRDDERSNRTPPAWSCPMTARPRSTRCSTIMDDCSGSAAASTSACKENTHGHPSDQSGGHLHHRLGNDRLRHRSRWGHVGQELQPVPAPC